MRARAQTQDFAEPPNEQSGSAAASRPLSLDSAALGRLRAMLEGGPADELAMLVEGFMEDATQQIETIQTALTSGYLELLRRTAHTLKSNAATFGASLLSEHCQRLEGLTRSGGMEGAEGLVAAIEEAFEQVRPTLDALRQA
ncbi:MAG: Hpt domain-containing protein [Dehalococcoidia bacterium]